jgi:CBS domain-containing protein
MMKVPLSVVEHHQAQRDLERDREGHAAVVTLVHRVLRLAEVVRVELQHGVVVVVGDGEHRLEDRLEAVLLPAIAANVLLEERLVGALLHLDEVRDLHDGGNLPEVTPAAAPTLNRACHRLS